MSECQARDSLQPRPEQPELRHHKLTHVLHHSSNATAAAELYPAVLHQADVNALLNQAKLDDIAAVQLRQTGVQVIKCQRLEANFKLDPAAHPNLFFSVSGQPGRRC